MRVPGWLLRAQVLVVSACIGLVSLSMLVFGGGLFDGVPLPSPGDFLPRPSLGASSIPPSPTDSDGLPIPGPSSIASPSGDPSRTASSRDLPSGTPVPIGEPTPPASDEPLTSPGPLPNASGAPTPEPSPTATRVDLSVGGATVRFRVPGMFPGQVAVAEYQLSNVGAAPLRYGLASESTNGDGKGLPARIQLVIRTAGAGCGAFDGETIYAGALDDAAFGDSSPGLHAGDRELAPGSAETLCLRAELPASTGNALQGATTTTTFRFSAEASGP